MKKDRLIAFTDAVLAIIMTILVLGLEKPDELSIAGFWALRNHFFAYWLSFFWLGSVWIAMNSIWENVGRVSRVVAWVDLIFLFLSSFMPYATGLVSSNFDNRLAQAFYGIVVIATTISLWLLHKVIVPPNSENKVLRETAEEYRRLLLPDIAIKVVALILALTVHPPIMMYGVLIAATYIQLSKAILFKKRGWIRF